MKKYLVIGVVLSVLMGCASPQKQADTTATVGPAHPVYGKLEEIDGHYQFTEFMAYGSLKNNREPWVRLSDRKPMWRLWEEKSCFFGVSESQKISNTCKTENRRLFHTGGRTRSTAMAEAYMTAWSLGMLQVMRVTGAGTLGTVSLNRELLDQAYAEASAAKGLTPAEIAAYTQQVAESKATIIGLYDVRKAFQNRYNKDNTKSFALIHDKTSIDRYANTDFSRYVHIYPPVFTEIKREFTDVSLKKLALDIQFLPSYLTSLWEDEAKDVSCEAFPEGVHHFDVDIACMSFVSPDGVYTTSTTIDINNYWSGDLMPDALDVADSNVTVSLEGGAIYVKNTSSVYIDIMNLSFHYGDRLATFNTDSSLARKFKGLAPNQRVWLGALDNAFTRNSTVSARFKSKAQAVNFKEKYGFSARYSMNGKIYNLHQTKQFSGYDML